MKNFNILTLFSTFLITLTPVLSSADVGGLTKCSESASFNKRLKTTLKKLQQRKSQYQSDTPPALALEQQIERTTTANAQRQR